MVNEFIPISITKAQVKAVSLSYDEDRLKFQADVALINDIGQTVTSIYIGNRSYVENERAELSLECIDLAKRIREEVNISVIRFMNAQQKVIDSKAGE